MGIVAECTEAERALIDACLKKDGFYGAEYDEISAAAAAVGTERVTPELKEKIRENFRKQIEINKEQYALSRGIPNVTWQALVRELYPKEAEQ